MGFTYLLWLRFFLCRVELLGLLCMVRDLSLGLAEFLGLVLHLRLAGFLLRSHLEWFVVKGEDGKKNGRQGDGAV